MTTILSTLLALVHGTLLFCLAYRFFLLIASVPRPAVPPAGSVPTTRFAIAIPAHNEGVVIQAILAQLARQDYPSALYDVHVVADHCTDETADLSRAGGAVTHERTSLPRGRKAYALRWLLDRILAHSPAYDAIAIFDADSLVDTGFLRAADAHLRDGAKALQGQHIISNPGDGRVAAMAAVDMRLNNRGRNQSRRNLGLSCRLMGDAMVLDSDLLRTFGWLGVSMNEDREYGYELLARGIKVRYVPEARSYGQAVSSWGQAEPQRLRWYAGIVDLQRRFVPRLVMAIWHTRSLAPLDGLLELLTPSYSFLFLASFANLVITWALAKALEVTGLLDVVSSALVVAAFAAYPLAGLAIDKAPPWAFRTLLLGPVYLAWRLWISILVRVRGDRVAWIRTVRREETQ